MANKELRSVFDGTENVSPEVMIGGVKGNTVVWNQMVTNGDFSTNSNWSGRQSTVSISNGIATVTPSSEGIERGLTSSFQIPITSGHKYLLQVDILSPITSTVNLSFYGIITTSEVVNVTANTWCRCAKVIPSSSTVNYVLYALINESLTTSQTIKYKNFICVDLTKMFGSGNEPTATEFQQMFPASYYPYNAGMLLSTYGSVKLNQLTRNGNFNGTNNWSTIKSNISTSDGIITVVSNSSTGEHHAQQELSFSIGHKLYFTATQKTDGTTPQYTDKRLLFAGSGDGAVHLWASTTGVFQRLEAIITVTDDGYNYLVRLYTPAGGTTQYKNVMVIDLTEMFGAGNEPTTVDEFRKLFPDDYYEYNPTGTWVPVGNSGLSSTGFNLWDEEWETGEYDTMTGVPNPSSSYIRCKGYQPCSPNTQYYCASLHNYGVYITFYKSDKTYISGIPGINGTVFSSPSNAYYFRICAGSSATPLQTYNNDICINLSDSNRNGTYEPYWKGYYSLDFIQSIKTPDGEKLFPNGLLSGTSSNGTYVYDEITPEYVNKKMNCVDLGTLTWVRDPYSPNDVNSRFICMENIGSVETGDYSSPAGICPRYTVHAWQEFDPSTDKIICLSPWTGGYGDISINDPDYNSSTTEGLAAFKNSLKGVMCTYQLMKPMKVYFQNTLFNKNLGKTIQFNQMVSNGNFNGTTNWSIEYGAVLNYCSNNEISVTYPTMNAWINHAVGMTQNHKYYLAGTVKTTSQINLSVAGVGGISFTSTSFERKSNVFNWHPGTTTWGLIFNTPSDNNATAVARNIMLIDLTEMFGAGNEPSTPEEFEVMFPADYYPYTAGSALTVTEDGYMVPGFNQWDESFGPGYISTSTGEVSPSTTNSVTVNFIPCFPSTTYYYRVGTSMSDNVYFYDANQAFITYATINSNSTFTTPSNCYYFKETFDSRYGTVYNYDICFNISDTSKNGTYEAYSLTTVSIPQLPAFRFHADPDGVISTVTGESWSEKTKENIVKSLKDPSTGEQLFPYGLLKAGEVEDVVTTTYTVKNVGCINMGNLTYWTNNNRFVAVFNATSSVSNSAIANVYCERYTATSYNILTYELLDKSIAITNDGTGIYLLIRDSSYSSASTFSMAMKEVYLYYELASPTTIIFTSNLDNNTPPLLSAPLSISLNTLNV